MYVSQKYQEFKQQGEALGGGGASSSSSTDGGEAAQLGGGASSSSSTGGGEAAQLAQDDQEEEEIMDEEEKDEACRHGSPKCYSIGNSKSYCPMCKAASKRKKTEGNDDGEDNTNKKRIKM